MEKVEVRPPWLKVQATPGPNYHRLKSIMRGNGLHTVCEEAHCPNIFECWDREKTATFMILGDTCTRNCRFCAVKSGRPGAVDIGEPERVAEAVHLMALDHVVITAVDRDDLADGGAGIFAATIRAVRRQAPTCQVEVLTGDFQGDREALAQVIQEAPELFDHNLETVRRLTPRVRSRATYDRSLGVLREAKVLRAGQRTKSSLMVGVGETWDELLATLDDLGKSAWMWSLSGNTFGPPKNKWRWSGIIPRMSSNGYGKKAWPADFCTSNRGLWYARPIMRRVRPKA